MIEKDHVAIHDVKKNRDSSEHKILLQITHFRLHQISDLSVRLFRPPNRRRYWKSWIGLPLGTRRGISLRRFSGLAFGSSKPFLTKSTSSFNSSVDRLIGVVMAGSSRASTGAIGPRGDRRAHV